jgi:hypothetical protein
VSDFTPGPWWVTKNNVDGAIVAIGAPGDNLLGIDADGYAVVMNPHDAQLISAAPAMYEALLRAKTLLQALTLAAVIGTNGRVIEAAGLNPWCINEGLATGQESVDVSWLDAVLSKAEGKYL